MFGNNRGAIGKNQRFFEEQGKDSWFLGLRVLTCYSTELEAIRRTLKDFARAEVGPGGTKNGIDFVTNQIDRNLFPSSGLLFFLLNGLCGFPLGPRGDKTHWNIPFKFKGIHCGIKKMKFGLWLNIDRGKKDAINPDEILGKLNKAIKIAETRILQSISKEQIKNGNIIVKNLFHSLKNRYLFFREQADLGFSKKGKEQPGPYGDSISDRINNNIRLKNKSINNSLAMIDAYFSWLEHFFVLSLPFVSFDRRKDDLSVFVGKLWSEKMKRVLDIENPFGKKFYDQLTRIKERYRNTFAHGGFEKEGASFFFHLPGFGAVPAKMSGYRHSVHFNYYPIESEDFQEICAFFDGFDKWLEETALPFAWKYAYSGLNLDFGEEALKEMLCVASCLKDFDKWLDIQSEIETMVLNADY